MLPWAVLLEGAGFVVRENCRLVTVSEIQRITLFSKDLVSGHHAWIRSVTRRACDRRSSQFLLNFVEFRTRRGLVKKTKRAEERTPVAV